MILTTYKTDAHPPSQAGRAAAEFPSRPICTLRKFA